MGDKDSHAASLGVRAPWSVRDVELRAAAEVDETSFQHGH